MDSYFSQINTMLYSHYFDPQTVLNLATGSPFKEVPVCFKNIFIEI